MGGERRAVAYLVELPAKALAKRFCPMFCEPEGGRQQRSSGGGGCGGGGREGR